MFHLQSLELLQWDYCQRLTLPLDGAIITVAGPNGSGKTTLLDAMRTLLGLDCSGGRNYKTYARHANADTTWLRAVVDNRPHGRQTSSRPFARNLLYADQVTLACRIDRNGGDWQRRYLMADGDVPIETLIQAPDKDWLGIEHWRKRLEGAGLSRAIARVLALEQGQTDRLCEYSPKELLRLVFDVFGDQEVLDRYEEARRHLREQEAEVEVAERELAHGRAQLAELAARVNQYRQYQMKLRERETLATEVVPVLEWHEDRQDAAARLNELRRQRLHQSAQRRQRAEEQAKLLQWLEARQAAQDRVQDIERRKADAQSALQQAREAEKPVEERVRQADELQGLAAIEGDAAQLAERVRDLEAQKSDLDRRWHDASARREQVRAALDGLRGQRQAPPPPEVQRFQRTLRQQDIGHHLMADVIEITDDAWRDAAEGVLRAARWVVVLDDPQDEGRAMALAEKERYRHYLVADAEHAPSAPPPDSLLAVLRFADTAPGWLLHQLAQIRRVADTQAGARAGGEWITPQAYWRDRRGGRSVWIDPSEHQFGAAALTARTEALERQVAQLDRQLTELAQQEQALRRQLDAARKAGEGHRAAETLIRDSEAFERARQQWPALKQARIEAGERWQALEEAHKQAIIDQNRADNRYQGLQQRLAEGTREAEQAERKWRETREGLGDRIAASHTLKRRFPTHWIAREKRRALLDHYQNATQARLRAEAIEQELRDGQWETDAAVEEKEFLMRTTVGDQAARLETCKARNAAAGTAVANARERYIDVLRATVRRYRKNITDLGALAGVEVVADLPHLDNDDNVLRQAELKVSFNFDGKGRIGLNDGEASGGQQVIKSLILLVGLLKDDDMSGGFVFIDEPFAHLDVRNIQLVGHFLKSTRAQYVLTTPITHNVEVFEPADITLVTSKKPRDTRWAPPIGVLQRRAEQPSEGVAMSTPGWIDEAKSRTRRERRADVPIPEAPPLLDPEPRDLLCRWVRHDARRRTRGALIKDAGPAGIERAEALCAQLLDQGWIVRCEQLQGGAWQWDALIWRDLPRLQALLDVAGPGRRAETRQALLDQAEDWLRAWRTDAADPDPDLLDELERALAQLAEDRTQGPDRLARRLDLLRALAAWHDTGESGTRRDFALRAGGDTKALTEADWRWLESGFDLERLRIARFALMAWLAGDVTLHWPAGQSLSLGHLHCIGLPLDDLIRAHAAATPQRWWLIENRASFERQARQPAPGTALLWMPGRPPTAWRDAVAHLLRLAPAPAWISADADPSGVDIACSVGDLWQSMGLAWAPHRMGVAEWAATAQTWPLNTHDRRLLDRLLGRPELPDGLRALCQAMRTEGRKAEQEAWL